MVDSAPASPVYRGLAQASEGNSPSTSPRSRLSFFFSLMDKDVPSLISSASIAAGVSFARCSKMVEPPSSPDSCSAVDTISSPGYSKWTPLGTWSTAALALALAVVPRCFTGWQMVALGAAFMLILVARALSLTTRLRRVLQPLVLEKVVSGTKTVQAIQRFRHPVLDSFMSFMARAVSVEFYTAFLPIVFWSGREDLGMALACLLALSLYMGNGLKDVVCAPRPFSPPVERITGSKMEVHSSREYGLPSTHTINIVSLSLYMLHWIQERPEFDARYTPHLVAALFAITVLVVFGRLYLGMHSPIDVAAGLVVGLLVTAAWWSVDRFVLEFLRTGPNVLAFSLAVCTLGLLAYPCPEDDTPSFEDHTAFTAVIMGLSASFVVNLAPGGASLLAPEVSSIPSLAGRVAVGLPLVLVSKALGKEIGKILWPAVLRTFNVPLYSKKYLKNLAIVRTDEKEINQARKEMKAVDVDVLIRISQYAALAWSVQGLVPWLFIVAGL